MHMHKEKTIKQARLIPQTLASWKIEKKEWCKNEPDRTRTVGPYDPEHRHIFFIS